MRARTSFEHVILGNTCCRPGSLSHLARAALRPQGGHLRPSTEESTCVRNWRACKKPTVQ